MTEKIISIIRTKFIENLNEGLLLREDFNNFELTESDKNYYRRNFHSSTTSIYHNERDDIIIPDKKNPRTYLTAILLKTKQKRKKDDNSWYSDYYQPFDKDFEHHFHSYWQEKLFVLKDILNNAPEFVNAETISDKDLAFINVGYRWTYYEGAGSYHPKLQNAFQIINENISFKYYKKADCKDINATFADIFIFTTKYFIKLSLGANGVLDRTEHIIQRDIKKLNIVDNNKLEIYFHGHFDPEIIVLDNYKSALQIQRHLTELRQVRSDNKNRDNKPRK